MSSNNTVEITEPKCKTPKNVLKSVSEYQKRNPEKCAEKTRNYYKRVKADPERYAKFLLRHANYRKMKKLEKEEKEAQSPEQ